jgi:hypothetical protein
MIPGSDLVGTAAKISTKLGKSGKYVNTAAKFIKLLGTATGISAYTTGKNIVAIPTGEGSIHSKISAYYSSKVTNLIGDKTVRDWLADKSFEYQFEFGKKYLEQLGSLKETDSGWIFIPYEASCKIKSVDS